MSVLLLHVANLLVFQIKTTTVNNNCYLIAKRILEAHWHCLPKIFSRWPVKELTQPVVHGIYPRPEDLGNSWY